jgi:hypothetical protein
MSKIKMFNVPRTDVNLKIISEICTCSECEWMSIEDSYNWSQDHPEMSPQSYANYVRNSLYLEGHDYHYCKMFNTLQLFAAAPTTLMTSKFLLKYKGCSPLDMIVYFLRHNYGIYAAQRIFLKLLYFYAFFPSKGKYSSDLRSHAVLALGPVGMHIVYSVPVVEIPVSLYTVLLGNPEATIEDINLAWFSDFLTFDKLVDIAAERYTRMSNIISDFLASDFVALKKSLNEAYSSEQDVLVTDVSRHNIFLSLCKKFNDGIELLSESTLDDLNYFTRGNGCGLTHSILQMIDRTDLDYIDNHDHDEAYEEDYIMYDSVTDDLVEAIVSVSDDIDVGDPTESVSLLDTWENRLWSAFVSTDRAPYYHLINEKHCGFLTVVVFDDTASLFPSLLTWNPNVAYVHYFSTAPVLQTNFRPGDCNFYYYPLMLMRNVINGTLEYSLVPGLKGCGGSPGFSVLDESLAVFCIRGNDRAFRSLIDSLWISSLRSADNVVGTIQSTSVSYVSVSVCPNKMTPDMFYDERMDHYCQVACGFKLGETSIVLKLDDCMSFKKFLPPIVLQFVGVFFSRYRGFSKWFIEGITSKFQCLPFVLGRKLVGSLAPMPVAKFTYDSFDNLVSISDGPHNTRKKTCYFCTRTLHDVCYVQCDNCDSEYYYRNSVVTYEEDDGFNAPLPLEWDPFKTMRNAREFISISTPLSQQYHALLERVSIFRNCLNELNLADVFEDGHHRICDDIERYGDVRGQFPDGSIVIESYGDDESACSAVYDVLRNIFIPYFPLQHYSVRSFSKLSGLKFTILSSDDYFDHISGESDCPGDVLL